MGSPSCKRHRARKPSSDSPGKRGKRKGVRLKGLPKPSTSEGRGNEFGSRRLRNSFQTSRLAFEHATGAEKGFLHGQVVFGAEVGAFFGGDASGELAQIGELQRPRGQFVTLPIRLARAIRV